MIFMRHAGTARRLALGVGKLGLLIGTLSATFGVFAFAGLQLGLKTREVSVPTIGGLTPAEAEVVLADASLVLRVEAVRRVHQTIDAGRIAEQNPGPSVTTRRNRSVKVWLSSGHTPGAVPTLIGASEQAARRRLKDNAFGLRRLSEIESSRYPTDAVVAQDPPPAGRGRVVALLINRGERGLTYVMPDLIGVDGTAAANILRNKGFRVTVVGEQPYPGIPPGIVLRQSPQGGFQIAPGEPISLEVSR